MAVNNLNYDNFDELSASFADLPMEIIQNIFRYLNFDDIKSAALTCHRWLEATLYSEFQSKFQMKFTKLCLTDDSIPAEIFAKSYRTFSSLYLDETIFGSLPVFFQAVGKSIENLTIIATDLTTKQLCSIIKQTKNLKHLTIENCSALFMAGQFLESIEDRDSIKDSISSVTSLSLRKNQYLTDAILLRLTSLIKSIEKLDMCGCHIAHHNALQRRFYPPNLESTPSESILTFKYLMKVIEKHASTLKELDLSYTLIGGPGLSQLVDTEGLVLKKITFNFCRQLNFTGLNMLADTQKQLVELNVSNSDGINDACVELLANNLTVLEVFRLKRCRKLTNLSAISIANLKMLKVLDLSMCDGISSDGIKNGVASTKNEHLIELRLVAIDLCETCVIQCAEYIINLRILDIGDCRNGVTDRALQAIIKNLVWLQVLNIEGCVLITDAGITGHEMKGVHSTDNLSQSSINISPTLSLNEPVNVRISLRSKAEEEIVKDAQRKQMMLDLCEMNLMNVDCNSNKGHSIKNLKGLQLLNLQGCTKITDVSLCYGLQFLELRKLYLSNCQQISLIGMRSLVGNCPTIEELDLSDCYNINDKAIEIITQKLKRLKTLNLSGCLQLTDHSVDSIAVNCKLLQSISMNRCRSLQSDLDVSLINITSLRNINFDRPFTVDNMDILRVKRPLNY